MIRLQDRKLVGHEFDLRKLDMMEGAEVCVVARSDVRSAIDALDTVKQRRGSLTSQEEDLLQTLNGLLR